MMFIDIHSHLHEAVNVAYKLHGGEGVTDVEVIKPRVEENIAEYVDAVLSRFSVFDLREVEADELDRAVERLERGTGFIGVYKSGERNLINWYQIASGEHLYEIRNFATFWFCSCPGFVFGRKERTGASAFQTCCKHIGFIHSQQKGKVNYDNSSQSAIRRNEQIGGRGSDADRCGDRSQARAA
jgi:hypothetical protein